MENETPPKNLAKENDKGKVESFAHARTSDIKCFKCLGRSHIVAQCPTKRSIILRALITVVVKKSQPLVRVRVRALKSQMERIHTLVKEIFS